VVPARAIKAFLENGVEVTITDMIASIFYGRTGRTLKTIYSLNHECAFEKATILKREHGLHPRPLDP
jgi:hypothetical protein